MLDVAGVSLTVDGAEHFDHRFAAGEITVVLGANHAGKTDLCRLIAGLHTCARGEIRLDDSDLDGLKPQQRSVSLVYQAFVNYPNLTVAENIASPLRARRMTAAARRNRVNQLATMLQIADLLERYPHELSGGQQQRLAIARALAKDARALLLDEPLVNLDFKLREALEYELRDLLRSTDTVVIYTSSDPRDAFALGDQVLLLEGGRKVQAGTPIEVYRRPINFVAMELLAEPCINRFTRAGKTCALRPEHVTVGGDVDAANMIRFDMSVTACETNGDDSFIHGRVDECDWVVRSYGMQEVRAGSLLSLYARTADVVSF
ncbi:MAG: ABC transporter ATP-binding protein [Proteobacteria bacterium]|nr:ABC transporter ATP-binding protein [Pseudomonadota bacterium]